MRQNDDIRIFWVMALVMAAFVAFVLLVGPVSAGGQSSQGTANYADYEDSPVGTVTSYIVNGVETDYNSIASGDNTTYLDFNGNPIPRDGTIKYYGSVATVINSSIQASVETPIWLTYTMPAKFEGVDAPYEIYELTQGQSVYLDTHYDISNAIAGTGVLAWFKSGVPSATEQPVLLELPYQKRGYYDFYIDPAVFGTYTGNWYKWDGMYSPNENSIAFYVVNTVRNATLTMINGTVVATNVSYIQPNTTFEKPWIEQKSPPLPKVYVADYLVARGDPLSVGFEGDWKLWLFGSTAELLDVRAINGTVNIGAETMQSLPEANYKLIQQQMGTYTKDFVFRYNNEDDSYQWFDPKTFTVKTESIATIRNTWLTYNKFKEILPTTQDKYTEWTLELQAPEITINRMDEVGEKSAKNFYLTDDVRGNVSLQNIRGYTNLALGTRLSVYLDYIPGARDQKPVYTYVQDNGGAGYKRVYNATLAVYYEGISPGMHSITVMTDAGKMGIVTQADFMVNVMPSDSYVPAQTVKWIGDVNPWSLNTTVQPPQIVERVVEVEKRVVVEVPPSDAVVKAQQMAALYDIVMQIVVVIGLIGVAFYARSVYIRTKQIKKNKELLRWKN